MRRLLSPRLALGALVVSLVLVAPPAHAQKASATTFEYSARFHLSVPDGWETRHDIGGMCAFVASPVSGPDDTFRENVNVVIDGLLATMTPDEYDENNLTQMQRGLPGFAVVKSAETELAGYPTLRMVYEHQPSTRRLRALIYVVRTPDRAYVLTGTAPTETYDEYEPAFESIIRSFVPE